MSITDIAQQVCSIIKGTTALIKNTEDLEIQAKSQGNFVTSIDIKVEKHLKAELGKLLPETGFLSEESDADIKKTNWIIDPIDGTGNMISGFPYTISVALSCDGETELGVVYNVQRKELYYAIKGMGAYKESNDGILKQITVAQFSTKEGISIFGVPYDRSKTRRILNIMEKVYSISSDIKRIGPASLDICRVAEGRAKMYIELDLQWWDYAAGEIILKEAGGCMLVKNDFLIFAASNSIIDIVNNILVTEDKNNGLYIQL